MSRPERRRFWAVDGGRVQEVEAMSLGRYAPDRWWVPELAASLLKGKNLFETRPEAVSRAAEYLSRWLDDVEMQRQDILAKIEALEKEDA